MLVIFLKALLIMDSCLNVEIFPLNMKVPIRPVLPLKCMCTVVYSTSLPYLHQPSLESGTYFRQLAQLGKYVALHGYRTFACLDDSARAICLSASSLNEGRFLSNKPTNHLIALISSSNFRSSICVSTLFYIYNFNRTAQSDLQTLCNRHFQKCNST